MKTNKSPTRFKWIQRLAGLVTALAMVFVSTGSAHARILFQDDDFHDIASEGIFLNFDGTPGTDTAKLDVDSSGNLTIDADGEIDTTDPVNFSAAASTRLREETFSAYTGVGSAPACATVGEVAVDLTTNALFVCTNATTDTWKSADNNPAPGTTDNAILKWDTATSAWVEETNFLVDDSGNGDFAGTIQAGSNNITITTATGNLDGEVIADDTIDDDSIDFGLGVDQVGSDDLPITDTNAFYTSTNVDGALDEIATEFGNIDFEYVYGNDLDSTLTASGTFDVDATGAVGIDSDAAVTVGGAGISVISDGGALALTGDGVNDIDVSNAGAAIDMDSATFTLDTTSTFSVDGVGTSNVTTDTGDLQLYTTTSGDVDINAATDVNVTAAADINFTDQYDNLTFAQTSAGLGNDLLNAAGELFSSTGTIGATIGAGGETSTSLVHAINAVGTYAANIGAGANDDLDDVYNNGPVIATLDNGDTGYNITSADSYLIQDGGTAVFEISGAGDVNFDPTSGQNFDVTTLGTGDFVVTSADDVDINSATINMDATGAGSLDFGAASNVTTSAGALTLDGASGVNIAGNASEVDVTTTGALDMNSGAWTWDGSTAVLTSTSTFDVDSTGVVTIDSDAGSTLSGTTVDLTSDNGDVTITSQDDIIFDDAQLTGTVQMSAADADWDTDFATDGIVDNINDIATLLGGDTISTFNFTEDNVLADNDAVYAALDKLDLKWGDLASTANGEGASLVGIEDAGGYFTSTDVEGALQELALTSSAETETLRFYPEYPDAVFNTSARGKLESVRDGSEGNAYLWTTKQNSPQAGVLYHRFELPADFTDSNDLNVRYRTNTALVADNSVAVEFYNVTDSASCGTAAAAASAGWTFATIAEATIETGCTAGTALNAGDIVEVRITFTADDSNSGEAYAGYIDYDYDN